MSDGRALLLDTNAWFWLVTGDARLSAELVDALDAAAREGRLCLSQISTWEIAVKCASGKIRLNGPIAVWLRQNTDGLRLLDLPLDVVVDATNLPGEFHKDPAVRFIVATARHHHLRLVTGDAAIVAYGRHGHVDVVAV